MEAIPNCMLRGPISFTWVHSVLIEGGGYGIPSSITRTRMMIVRIRSPGFERHHVLVGDRQIIAIRFALGCYRFTFTIRSGTLRDVLAPWLHASSWRIAERLSGRVGRRHVVRTLVIFYGEILEGYLPTIRFPRAHAHDQVSQRPHL